jgi:uncharacterized protein involved in exopolysaccharide biosynthesis
VIEQRPTTQTQTQTQSINIDDEPIVDLKALGNYAGFVVRATKRRRGLIVTTFLAAAALVAVLCVVLPRVYKVSTRILTHRSLVMPALVHPDRSIPQAADAPTSGAVELIKSRENLENLMTDTKLEEKWEKNRSVLWKAKDKVLGSVTGAVSAQDKHESFLKLLDERITASVDNEVVSMDIEWPDAEIAMNLAEGAVARFLKIRHDMELSEILETVTILERNVESSRQGIEAVVARMQKIVDSKEREFESRSGGGHSDARHRSRRSRVIAIRRPAGAEHMDPAMDDLKKNLGEKQASVSQIKRAFEARLKKAQEKVNQLRASLGPEHPDFVEARRDLESLSQPPPELVALQSEEARLAAQMSALPTGAARDIPKVKVETAGSENPGEDADIMRVPVSDELYAEIDKDPEIASVMEEIKKLEDAHDDLLQRLANARIESETANVAFEYRYLMTQPPVNPKKAIKPNFAVLIGGGLTMALLLGVLFAVVSDLMSQKILEAWQLERFLKLKLLGEIQES